MSLTKTAPTQHVAGQGVDLAGLGATRMPQVNLLPNDIRSRRALGRVKVRLGIALLFVVLVAALGFVGAIMVENAAAGELALKQQEVERLTAEQQQYAEVPQVKSEIAAIEAARELGMSTEVLWGDYLAAIQAVSPDGVSIQTLTTTMPSPTQLPVIASNPLAGQGVGEITFTTRSAQLPDIAAWITALESVPGFHDAYMTSAEVTDQSGVVYYETASSVVVDDTVFAQRFIPEEGQ